MGGEHADRTRVMFSALAERDHSGRCGDDGRGLLGQQHGKLLCSQPGRTHVRLAEVHRQPPPGCILRNTTREVRNADLSRLLAPHSWTYDAPNRHLRRLRRGPRRGPRQRLDGTTFACSVCTIALSLDRIVTSVAGEPPQTLRRRILLEQAAYRLISTDHTVLDVATEARYASRGVHLPFRRTFGQTPARWRRAPRAIRIDAPSEVHFHFHRAASGCRRHEKVTAMDLLTRMVEHHIWLTGDDQEVAARLDDATRPGHRPLGR